MKFKLKKTLKYIFVPTLIISLTACLHKRRIVSEEVNEMIGDLKKMNSLGKGNEAVEDITLAEATQAIVKAESTQLQTDFELRQYLKSCSLGELNELANELIRIGVLDIRSHCRDSLKVRSLAQSIHNLPTFIRHFTSTNENNGWYNLEQYHREILYACFELVKLDMEEGFFDSHIRGAKFYDSWNEMGYINEIKDSLQENNRL